MANGAIAVRQLRQVGDLTSGRSIMTTDHVYKISELAGSSEKSIEDAIENAISRASATLRNLRWFEVTQIRGHIADDGVHHYQVTLKVGFTLQDK
jgi:flavin-binding protein dodecin